MATTGKTDVDGMNYETTSSRDRASDEEKGIGTVQTRETNASDDPFGDESNSEVKYRTMSWWFVFALLRNR